MSATAETTVPEKPDGNPGEQDPLAPRPVAPSPAGPVDETGESAGGNGSSSPPIDVRMPPALHRSRLAQTLMFGMRPLDYSLAPRRRYGDVWMLSLLSRDEPFVMTCHPEHVESLFKADPDDAPSLTGESPLRPILGPNSVLTLTGPRHLRERKLLLPPFHGKAVERYVNTIKEIAQREIDSWPLHKPFSLAARMQAVTLDVIMGGVFGVEGQPAPGTTEYRIREIFRRLLRISTKPAWQLVELQNIGRPEPRGILKTILGMTDRQLYSVIQARRQAGGYEERDDIFSLLLRTRYDDGEPLTDQHIRDELMSLVLAGHETTANSLAWTFERLTRNPEPYAQLRTIVREGSNEDADAYVEATVNEGMRQRPVIPIVVRMVKRPWRLGDYVVPANTPVGVSIVALHHREDVYPDPERFAPERFLGRKPGTYTWIPFGGGIRRCLGATLAMAEQRVVLKAIAQRTDLAPPTAKPEPARQRNVTMIPGHGGQVVVHHKR